MAGFRRGFLGVNPLGVNIVDTVNAEITAALYRFLLRSESEIRYFFYPFILNRNSASNK